MKKFIIALVLCFFCFAVSGCGNNKFIDGKEYTTYGVVNEGQNRNDNIEYELIYGNVFWSGVLCWTGIAPTYFFGFSMYEPVGVRTEEKGVVGTWSEELDKRGS